MSEKLMKKSGVYKFALLVTVVAAGLTLWGCGKKEYDDVAAQRATALAAAVTTTKSSSVIDALTLKGWIDEGKLNAPFGSKDRVVVVSASTFANWSTTTKGHIPGAVRLDPVTEISQSRVEGLALASSMMPDGSLMDSIVKKLGIDANTTIVFSLPKNSSIYDQAVPFWNFRYWGFARERLKILNGGDDAWEVAGFTLSRDTKDKYTPSTCSVSQNAALKDVVRYSLSEMIGKVDELIAKPDLKNTWQIIDVRGFTTNPYLTNAQRLSSATMYLKRLNGDATKNYVFPDKPAFEAALLDGTNYKVRTGSPITATHPTDGAHISATKKTVVMCGASVSASVSFVLFDAVLSVPEGDIAMYDGSSSQWNNYNTARLTAAYPNTIATAAQRNAWSFNVYTSPVNPLAISKNRAQGAFPSSMTSALAGIWAIFSPVLDPTHVDMNQIENIDKAYIKPVSAPSTPTSTTPSVGSNTGGGC